MACGVFGIIMVYLLMLIAQPCLHCYAIPDQPTCAGLLCCCRLCSVTDLKMASAVFVLPHPEKTARGGEDWYFIADNNRAIGIADGVGGWVSALCW